MQKPLDPMSVERTDTPSASYVLRRRYGPARHAIAVASWVTVIGMLFQPVAVLAGTVYWDGGGADDNWFSTANWSTAAAGDGAGTADPYTGGPHDLVFYSTTSARLTSGLVNSALAVNSLTFGNSQSGAVTIGGTQALTINTGGLTVNSGFGAVSISAPITLGGSQTWANNSANTLTVSGSIAIGANTLTINGTGAHALTVSSGTVDFNSTTASTYNPSVVQTFTTAGQTAFVAQGFTYTVQLWGGGGGGYTGTGGSRNGGGGGYTTGTLAMTAGKTYQIMVGGGGARRPDNSDAGSAVPGGGGLAGSVGYGGQGGGLSGIFDTSYTFATALAIAGAGGGAGYYSDGGAGGGSSGLDGVAYNNNKATGGNQTAGGTCTWNGGTVSINAGSALQGGSANDVNNGGGGGGGGGYYGGAAGSNQDASSVANTGGGGGSGYIGGLTGASTTAGSGSTPAGTGAVNYASGKGAGGQGVNNGSPGQVTITGPTLTGGNTVTLTSGTINFGSTGGGARVRILDVSAGTGTARADFAQPLTIESVLKLPSGVAATVSGGNTFTAKGSNLANNATARTLTLSGGTFTLSKSSTDITGGAITYSGGNAIHTFTTAGENTLSVPGTSAPNATVYIWGAGGGGGNGGTGTGGGGGYITGTLAMGMGKTYKIMVGGGGASIGASGGAGPAVPGGGGQLNSAGGWGGQGGGLSGIFDTTYSQANALAIAGGGGGASYDSKNGGPGGGTTGTAGQDGSKSGGGGGTQLAGGTSVPPGNGGTQSGVGSALQGGVPPSFWRSDSVWDTGGGGGGGGGYYGGGAGNNDWTGSGGGGGSGYIGGLTGATMSAGSGTTPGNTTSSYYILGRGVGGASGNNAGGAGLVVVVYPLPGVNLQNTAIAATATSTLDLAASTKDHILGNVNVTAGATLTVDNANKLTMGTLTIGINGANCGKLNLNDKTLALTGLAVTSVSPTEKEYRIAVAAANSFSTLHGTSVTDNNGKKWNVEVRAADGVAVDANGPQLWLVAASGGTAILFK